MDSLLVQFWGKCCCCTSACSFAFIERVLRRKRFVVEKREYLSRLLEFVGGGGERVLLLLVLGCKTLGGNAEGLRLTLLDGGEDSLSGPFSLQLGFRAWLSSFPGVRKFLNAPPWPLFCSDNGQVAAWAVICAPAFICKDKESIGGWKCHSSRSSHIDLGDRQQRNKLTLIYLYFLNKELNRKQSCGFPWKPSPAEISSLSVGPPVMEQLEIQGLTQFP